MLIEYGTDVTGKDKNLETQLHQALQVGQLEVSHMLIEHGMCCKNTD
jgi:ankyrin repeat protein